jgi:hypothetical protein
MCGENVYNVDHSALWDYCERYEVLLTYCRVAALGGFVVGWLCLRAVVSGVVGVAKKYNSSWRC